MSSAVRQLAAETIAGNRTAISEALLLVEDRRPCSMPRIGEFLRALASAAPQGIRVGLTGPPGVGKSSLVAALTRELRSRGRRVGVLAVDPSSPRSGGALLGDRARIHRGAADDEGVFIRSMASGGDLGGLARAASSVVEVLAAGHDVVLVETVGVGQSETDIELVADLTVLVLQPDSGDTLQFLKAGILEIPDLFALNKVDLGQSARTARQELLSALALGTSPALASHIPQVIMTSALHNQGVTDLLEAIDALHGQRCRSGEVPLRRRQAMIAWCQRALVRRVGELGIEVLGGHQATSEALAQGIAQGRHGVEVVADLANRVSTCWNGGT
jgi:LAO/AO transport system kinase